MNTKQILTSFFFLISAISASAQTESTHAEAEAVIRRFAANNKLQLQLSSINKENGCDVFETSVKNNTLLIKGSSGVALCRGFYDYVKTNKAGIASWSGNRYALPAQLPVTTTKVVSPVQHHYYLNVVTYGYTMPYWDWNRWQQEIDWMALHGIDMPLALVANEAISARVWKKLGLTQEEITNYFVGPAHLPWMRMGNISGIDGPLTDDWHTEQITLQHKILARMRALGMKPICPGFAGFVPPSIKRIYPNTHLIETSWSSGAFHNWMISPEDPLFATIEKMFIQEWEKEFGKNEYYIVDSFNEMDLPFPPKDDPERYKLLASYGEKVYAAIRSGNPDATWVMQGWMFGYQRDIWDYKTLEALLSKVPDDKMLLLDMAVDYSIYNWEQGGDWDYYKGFFNKPWIYSVIPNMGGKVAMTGVLSFYANGHIDALNASNKGKLVGMGMAPEGLENNEVIYELCADAGWSRERKDLDQWLKNYSICRYGKYAAALDTYWNGLTQSVYKSLVPHPRYNWQLRPGLAKKGTVRTNENFYKAIEAMADCTSELQQSVLFRADFIEAVTAYTSAKMETLDIAITKAYENKDTAGVAAKETLFCELGYNIDRLLASHPTETMNRWLSFAKKHGATSALKKQYEKNARRIVTIWGPPVDDYSARIWSGLIRDYYMPRWKMYFEGKRTGQMPDIAAWEKNWVEQQQGLSPVTPFTDVIKAGKEILLKAKNI